MSTTPSRPSIGVLGGSFNPAHAGHRDLSLYAMDRLALDGVWWLVTPGNPLKAPENYAPYDERLGQARRVADNPRITISAFEQDHSLQYTVDSLRALRKVYPDHRFVWLMGADSFAHFHLWRDWREIAAIAPMAIFNRPGYEKLAREGEAARALAAHELSPQSAPSLSKTPPPAWIFFRETDNPLSSTALRNAEKPDKE